MGCIGSKQSRPSLPQIQKMELEIRTDNGKVIYSGDESVQFINYLEMYWSNRITQFGEVNVSVFIRIIGKSSTKIGGAFYANGKAIKNRSAPIRTYTWADLLDRLVPIFTNVEYIHRNTIIGELQTIHVSYR